MREFSDIVVVGASLAGLRAAETLRAEGYAGRLTIVGSEEHPPYDRPPLSKELLVGTMEHADVELPQVEGLSAEWVLGASAVGLDVAGRAVLMEGGSRIAFDGLVLATGSGARVLPTFASSYGAGAGVHTLRTVADALRLRAALSDGTRLLIVGSGFIGVEVAASARSLGADVTVVGLDAPLAPAGRLVSEHATRLLRESGVRLHLGHGVASAGRSAEGAHRIVLGDGTELEVDEIVVSVGSVPNVAWLEGSGLEVEDGVVCDASLHAVGARDVVVAGDIARWPNATYGGMSMRIEHWSNAIESGAAAARSLLAGDDAVPFGSVPSFWSDHFGIRLQSVGLPRLADRFELLDGSPEDGRFAAAAYAGDVLVGAISYGMPRALVPVRVRLARHGVELEAARA